MNARRVMVSWHGLPLLAAIALTACAVNFPIVIADGETRSSGATTVNGAIRIGSDARVEGDVVIETSTGTFERERPLRILVSGDSVIQGDVIVEDPAFEAQLFVREGGKVLGRVQNIEAVEEPPADASSDST